MGFFSDRSSLRISLPDSQIKYLEVLLDRLGDDWEADDIIEKALQDYLDKFFGGAAKDMEKDLKRGLKVK